MQENDEYLLTDCSKSRLALVLCKDRTIQWETLVLSNEMIFKGKNKPIYRGYKIYLEVLGRRSQIRVTNIVNTPVNAKLKHRRSKKSGKQYFKKYIAHLKLLIKETTSNRRSKRLKTKGKTDLFSLNNPSSPNSYLPTCSNNAGSETASGINTIPNSSTTELGFDPVSC